MFWVSGNLLKSLATGPKQKGVEQLLIVKKQWSQLVWKSKNQMHVGNGQQLPFTGGQPLPAGIAETPWAMPIAATVVRDGHDMAASGTTVAVPTECCRTTVLDGKEHLAVQPCQPRPLSLDEAFACRSNDVSHLEGWSCHFFRFFRERRALDRSDTGSSSSGFGQARRCRWDRCRYTVV
jgi:hypothetical protein